MTHKKEIQFLNRQIEKLEAEDFDLEAWKSGTIVLLERLFGLDNQKIRQIEKIKYDQSSWALREAKGSKNMMETCKKQGKEILEIAKDELEYLGNTVQDSDAIPFKATIVAALEKELKIAQYREVVQIIYSDKPLDEKQKELLTALHGYGHEVADNILTAILLSEQTKNHL